MVEAAPSCALLGGFAIGALVALLWQHNANTSYKHHWYVCKILRSSRRLCSQAISARVVLVGDVVATSSVPVQRSRIRQEDKAAGFFVQAQRST